jgi:hypothetical protein
MAEGYIDVSALRDLQKARKQLRKKKVVGALGTLFTLAALGGAWHYFDSLPKTPSKIQFIPKLYFDSEEMGPPEPTQKQSSLETATAQTHKERLARDVSTDYAVTFEFNPEIQLTELTLDALVDEHNTDNLPLNLNSAKEFLTETYALPEGVSGRYLSTLGKKIVKGNGVEKNLVHAYFMLNWAIQEHDAQGTMPGKALYWRAACLSILKNGFQQKRNDPESRHYHEELLPLLEFASQAYLDINPSWRGGRKNAESWLKDAKAWERRYELEDKKGKPLEVSP